MKDRSMNSRDFEKQNRERHPRYADGSGESEVGAYDSYREDADHGRNRYSSFGNFDNQDRQGPRWGESGRGPEAQVHRAPQERYESHLNVKQNLNRNSMPFSYDGEHAGKGPKGYQRSDERIREEVCERLAAAPHIDPSEVEVDVKNGEVLLTGTVMDRKMKRWAEDSLEGISGLRDIHNQLHILEKPRDHEASRAAASLEISDASSGHGRPGPQSVSKRH